MTLMQQISTRIKKAHEAINSIARREAQGKIKSGDSDALAQILGESNKITDQYGEALTFFQREEDLRDKLKLLSHAESEFISIRNTLDKHKAKTEQLIKNREDERQVLQRKLQDAGAVMRRVKYLKSEIQIMEHNYPDRMGVKLVDLDSYTLMYGENIITLRDPGAPERYVDGETFAKESSRRAGILEQAHKKMYQMHQDELHAWVQRQPQNEDAPVFTATTWKDVMEHGLNCTLDDSAELLH